MWGLAPPELPPDDEGYITEPELPPDDDRTVYTHTHTHTHTHTRAHTPARARMHTHKQAHAHARTHAHPHPHTHTHMHAHKCARSSTQTQIHANWLAVFIILTQIIDSRITPNMGHSVPHPTQHPTPPVRPNPPVLLYRMFFFLAIGARAAVTSSPATPGYPGTP